jgi:electron transfer flavoprotein alpha subunit
MTTMTAAALRRINPRRPALITPAGLRRIVLGGTEGDTGRVVLAHGSAAKAPRSTGPFTGAVVVLAHAERAALDEAAREALAAAALLARPDEAVVLLCVGACRDDVARLAVDRAEVLIDGVADAAAVLARCDALNARHLLLPDRGADAHLGRHIAALALARGRSAATQVVELFNGQARMRAAGGQDALMDQPWLMLLRRQVARTDLPFVGLGEVHDAASWGAASAAPHGVQDLGLAPADAQSVPLEEADFILAAGNGVSDVPLFQRLAAALGAATGASRVAVDDGRFPRSKQVGATGKTVQARGYLAFGISGAVQHLQGIKECRHVMSVNTDASAPLAQRAELTVVADAQALMAALLQCAEQARAVAPAASTGVAA